MNGPRIAVIDYGIGNLASAHKALRYIGTDAVLTGDAATIAGADGVVLPGVGNFGACMNALRDAGLEDVARNAALDARPFLGICVGMQMLFDGSDESPDVGGLGIVPGQVRSLATTVKLPQIGWNTVEVSEESRMFDGFGHDPWFYFVHTYAPCPDDVNVVSGWCEYGTRFACAIERPTLWATQFHPEKSSVVGLQLLSNFVARCGVPA